MLAIKLDAFSAADRQFVAAARQNAWLADKGELGGWIRKLSAASGISVANLGRNLVALPALGETPVPPNMAYVRLSKRYLDRQVTRQVRESLPYRDSILGTSLYGQSQLNGQSRLNLTPNSQRAVFDVQFFGTTDTDTVGYNGPVRIYSHSHTQFNSSKQVYLDGRGVQPQPARTAASTQTTTTGIGADLPRLRGRIARRIASSRVADSKPQAEQIAARHAKQRISRHFDNYVQKQIASLKSSVASRLAGLPLDARNMRGGMHCITTSDSLLVAFFNPQHGDTAFVDPPVLDRSRPDIEVYIHRGVVALAVNEVRTAMGQQEPLSSLLQSLPGGIVPVSSAKPSPQSVPALQVKWTADSDWLAVTWNERK